MMKLKLVKGDTAYETASTVNVNAPAGDVNYVTKVLKELVEPWVVKGDRVVAEYLYFASVQSEKSLEAMGLDFVGVVKQAPHQYTMTHLQRK